MFPNPHCLFVFMIKERNSLDEFEWVFFNNLYFKYFQITLNFNVQFKLCFPCFFLIFFKFHLKSEAASCTKQSSGKGGNISLKN